MSNEINYIPAIVDIEGLQGINSSQGMEHYMPEMDPYYGMNEMGQNPMWPPMDNMYNMPPMNGMDNMYNMPPMNGMNNMNPMNGMYDPQGATCAEVISCMATMCYMMSVYLTQMLQGNNGMGMYPTPMYDCDCMKDNTLNNTYGYPPLY